MSGNSEPGGTPRWLRPKWQVSGAAIAGGLALFLIPLIFILGSMWMMSRQPVKTLIPEDSPLMPWNERGVRTRLDALEKRVEALEAQKGK